jgi:hypothetical protein
MMEQAWTSVNSINTARLNLAGAGIQTAALAFGGSPAPALIQEQLNYMMELVGQLLL